MDLSPIPPAQPAPPPAVAAVVDLYAACLAGRTAQTVRAYAGDYQDFARFLGADGPAAALEMLVSFPVGVANASALAYRHHLMSRQLAASTIARRLAALRSAVRLARQLGRCTWELEVESPRAETYRDTRGPGREGYLRVLARANEAATTPRGRRDLAILRLLHDLALRRSEVVTLDLEHVDLEASAVQVRGKGKTGRTPITLPGPTRAALADWIAARGDEPGPLFLNRSGGRISGVSLYRIIRELGQRAGLSRDLRPHGLRHQGITRALDLTGGNVREVRKFSRHSKVETLMVYDDQRADVAGKVAEMVADDG